MTLLLDFKLKFDYVFTQADCFPDFFSALLICSFSVFQHVKVYVESLVAARHNLGLQELGGSASGRGSEQAECCHCSQCS